jgi:hypothetical protein
MRVAIRRVSLASLAKLGCLLGVVAAFLPSLLCGLAGLGLSNLAFRWLQGWQEVNISLLGQELVRLDLVHTLGLDKLLRGLQVLTTASLPVLLLAVLSMALVSGMLLAIIIALVGLVYNLLATGTGGLVLEMNAVGRREGTEQAPAPGQNKT